jgi:hypothetical protein
LQEGLLFGFGTTHKIGIGWKRVSTFAEWLECITTLPGYAGNFYKRSAHCLYKFNTMLSTALLFRPVFLYIALSNLYISIIISILE